MWFPSANMNDLIGKTFTLVVNTGDAIQFINDEESYSLHHEQDCCESVSLDDVVGDLDDLVGSPITFSSEEYEHGSDGEYGDRSTWSFYKFGTVKGWVDVKFYGSSNGYYSESASLYKVK